MSVPATRDANGRDLAPLWALFSDEELRAAERMARIEKLSIHLLHRDPSGRGWRYLRLAQVALRGRDPGPRYRDPAAAPQPRKAPTSSGAAPRESAAERRALRMAPRA